MDGNRSLTHSDLLKRIELTLEQRLGQDSAVIFSYWNHARDSKILKALDEASEHSDAIRGTRFRRDRLYQIWGGASR